MRHLVSISLLAVASAPALARVGNVPEPGTWALMILGVAAAVVANRRRGG